MLSHQQSDYRIKFNINSIYRKIYKENWKKMNKEELVKLRNSVNELNKEIEIKPKNNITIFTDELESFNNISEQFKDLEFYWIPKELNISKKW